MKVEYINPFLESAISVFGTMIECDLKRQPPFLKQGTQPQHEISGIIGLSGHAIGTVVLGLDREVAIQATEVLLQERPDTINDDVRDAIGELTNMIAGGAKAKLEQLELSVSLPNILTGKNHCIEFPQGAPAICIPFACAWGTLAVEVGLVEQVLQPTHS